MSANGATKKDLFRAIERYQLQNAELAKEHDALKAKLAEAEKSMKAAAEYLNSGVVKNYLEKALARLRGDSK